MGATKLLRFLAGRSVKAVVVIIAIIVFQFLLIRLAPGDPASVIAGQSGAADPLFMQQLREQFGLDRPLHEQLLIYLRDMLSLDLGFSHRQQQPVAQLIFERLPATLLLTGTAFL
jgi:peptide/nickel transport system permease protein